MHVSTPIYLDALFLLLGDNSERSRTLVKEFLEATDRGDKRKAIVSADDELIDVYRHLIRVVIKEQISLENETAAKILLLNVKNNEILKSHPVIRDLLTDILTAEEPITATQIDEYLKRIRNSLLLAEIEENNRKVFARTQKVAAMTDPDEQEAELIRIRTMLDDSVTAFTRRQQTSDKKASETYVSLSDEESIVRALDTFKDRNIRGVIRTGLQGLNRAMGERGGFGLGEMAVFAAPSHNFKSGMLVAIMIWTIIYNKIVVEPGKKALVYFVSLENDTNQNLMDVFKVLYCRIEKKAVNLNELSTEVITRWLIDFFSQFNVELIMDRYSPHEFTFSRFMGRYNAFAEMNYQMILFDLDYMSEARGVEPGDTVSAQGRIQMIAENYIKFRSHANSQGYLLTTGHQLTKKADDVAAQYPRNAVKRFNPSMMADSSDVLRIVDMLFFMFLETNLDGHKFLTVINRKNRGCKDTPESHKFFAYPFTPFGIEDDLDGEPRYVLDIDAYGIEQGASADAISDAAMF